MTYLRSFQYNQTILIWTGDWEMRTLFMMSLNEGKNELYGNTGWLSLIRIQRETVFCLDYRKIRLVESKL